MSSFNFDAKSLKKKGWEILPNGVWFGFELAEAHKVNIPAILDKLIGLNPDAEGYDFLICAYERWDASDEEEEDDE